MAVINIMGKLSDVSSTLLVDNNTAASLVQDPKISSKTKHIKVHYHFVRKKFLEHEYQI